MSKINTEVISLILTLFTFDFLIYEGSHGGHLFLFLLFQFFLFLLYFFLSFFFFFCGVGRAEAAIPNVFQIRLRKDTVLAGVAQLIGVSSCKWKGYRFESLSGHIPR